MKTTEMIKHIVSFKITNNANKKENTLLLKDKLDNLKNKIPELLYLETGINISDRPAAFDLLLVTHFNSPEDLEAYRIHPLHQELVGFLNQIKEDIVVVDYEI
ncbi:MAG: Dabb family protein [Bacteroidales bacterium]|nr:Dabb family protein [Bacteroidales bacterium]